MSTLNKKKILVISSDRNDIAFVEAAHEMGLYVICCDRYKDWRVSPSKMIADEAWDIDYSKTEEIAKKCIENNVDGVIAGYGEDRVTAACRISKKIGKPFYATEEQISMTRDKRLFKKICEKTGVPTPKDYSLSGDGSENGFDQIVFPVIVKPSDNGGRKGISICNNVDELRIAIPYALDYSAKKKIVIEEYLVGIELCAVYTFSDGYISLSCLNDKYISEDTGGAKLCDAVLTPSKYYEKFVQNVHPGIVKLIETLGLENGMANFQLIANKNGIYAFEMGLRVNGNDDFKVIRKNNGIDFMKLIINYSITGKMGNDLAQDDPRFERYYGTFCAFVNAGTIGKISIGKITENENIYDITYLHSEGDVVANTGTNAHKAMMFKFVGKTIRDIQDTISFIQDNLIVHDIQGMNMLMKTFNVKRLD